MEVRLRGRIPDRGVRVWDCRRDHARGRGQVTAWLLDCRRWRRGRGQHAAPSGARRHPAWRGPGHSGMAVSRECIVKRLRACGRSTDTKRRVVIVGGGGTGDAAAFALRKRGFDGDISILSADRDRPYDRPYLSKEFLRGEVELPKVFLHEEADYQSQKIELRLEQVVAGGSLSERRLRLVTGEEIACDVLLV